MKEAIRNNIATTALVLVLAGFVVYGLFFNPADKTNALREATIQSCERGKTKAVLFSDFANEAAQARRRSAEKAQEAGDKVLAANEIATAQRYETYARQYIAATPQDCRVAFP